MKRNRLNALLFGSTTIAFFGAGVLTPGCESLLNNPQAYFTENPCSFFNCNTFSFLEEEHDGAVVDADHSEAEAVNGG